MLDQSVTEIPPAAAGAEPVPQPKADWFIIPRLFAAAVLLFAAGMKLYQLATEPVVGTGFFAKGFLANRWVNLLEADFEIAMALWLISGWARRLAWAVSLLLFATFSVITASEFFAGEASCGCFGGLTVPPLVTFFLDVTMLGLMIFLRPRTAAWWPFTQWRRFIIAWAVAIPIMVVTAIPAIKYTPAKIAPGGKIEGNSGPVELDPEEWAGQRLPIADFVDTWGELGKGTWMVVLVRHGCKGCAALMPMMIARAKAAPPGKALKLAIIQIPENHAYGDASAEWPADGVPLLIGKLDAKREWRCWTPTVMRLDNGVVRDVLVAQGEEARKKAVDMLDQ